MKPIVLGFHDDPLFYLDEKLLAAPAEACVACGRGLLCGAHGLCWDCRAAGIMLLMGIPVHVVNSMPGGRIHAVRTPLPPLFWLPTRRTLPLRVLRCAVGAKIQGDYLIQVRFGRLDADGVWTLSKGCLRIENAGRRWAEANALSTTRRWMAAPFA